MEKEGVALQRSKRAHAKERERKRERKRAAQAQALRAFQSFQLFEQLHSSAPYTLLKKEMLHDSV